LSEQNDAGRVLLLWDETVEALETKIVFSFNFTTSKQALETKIIFLELKNLIKETW
jgi:hypothetical protein